MQKKLHALHPELTMIATAHHAETVAEAYKEHLIINNTPCELKDFADCDYIFLCTPTRKNIEYLQQLKDVISPDCIITDVGSVKTEIHREVIRLGLKPILSAVIRWRVLRRPVFLMLQRRFWKMLTILSHRPQRVLPCCGRTDRAGALSRRNSSGFRL